WDKSDYRNSRAPSQGNQAWIGCLVRPQDGRRRRGRQKPQTPRGRRAGWAGKSFLELQRLFDFLDQVRLGPPALVEEGAGAVVVLARQRVADDGSLHERGVVALLAVQGQDVARAVADVPAAHVLHGDVRQLDLADHGVQTFEHVILAL